MEPEPRPGGVLTTFYSYGPAGWESVSGGAAFATLVTIMAGLAGGAGRWPADAARSSATWGLRAGRHAGRHREAGCREIRGRFTDARGGG